MNSFEPGEVAAIEAALPKQVIRTFRDPYRKRPRPDAVPSPYLCDVWLGAPSEYATPYVSVQALGKTVWCEFRTVQAFASREAALAYAAEHGITDHDLDGQ